MTSLNCSDKLMLSTKLKRDFYIWQHFLGNEAVQLKSTYSKVINNDVVRKYMNQFQKEKLENRVRNDDSISMFEMWLELNHQDLELEFDDVKCIKSKLFLGIII